MQGLHNALFIAYYRFIFFGRKMHEAKALNLVIDKVWNKVNRNLKSSTKDLKVKLMQQQVPSRLHLR